MCNSFWFLWLWLTVRHGSNRWWWSWCSVMWVKTRRWTGAIFYSQRRCVGIYRSSFTYTNSEPQCTFSQLSSHLNPWATSVRSASWNFRVQRILHILIRPSMFMWSTTPMNNLMHPVFLWPQGTWLVKYKVYLSVSEYTVHHLGIPRSCRLE